MYLISDTSEPPTSGTGLFFFCNYDAVLRRILVGLAYYSLPNMALITNIARPVRRVRCFDKTKITLSCGFTKAQGAIFQGDDFRTRNNHRLIQSGKPRDVLHFAFRAILKSIRAHLPQHPDERRKPTQPATCRHFERSTCPYQGPFLLQHKIAIFKAELQRARKCIRLPQRHSTREQTLAVVVSLTHIAFHDCVCMKPQHFEACVHPLLPPIVHLQLSECRGWQKLAQ